MEGWRPLHWSLLQLFLVFCVLFCVCVTAVQPSLPTPGVYWVQSTGTHRSSVTNHDLSLSAFKNGFSVEAKRSMFESGQFFQFVLGLIVQTLDL